MTPAYFWHPSGMRFSYDHHPVVSGADAPSTTG